ncbi:hypothetical protein EON65_26215 [archaeon]|nr:MAG: hypothetical protein EON65_26215 [archaeon]
MNFVKSFRRAALPILTGGISLGVYQGVKVRADFVRGDKLSVPYGPTIGRERIANAVKDCTDLIVETTDKTICEFISSQLEESAHELITALSHSSDISDDFIIRKYNSELSVATVHVPKRRRLVVMGDSLVAGVGCDDVHESPVLPKVIAAGLSAAFECEVMWYSEGIVGATVQDISTRIWPSVRGKIIREHEEKEEIMFIIICGLNDWKKFFLAFPNGVGPISFKSDLQLLVASIQHACEEQGQTCKIFLPTLPLSCLFSDPKFTLGLRPLRYLLQWICNLWDEQKQLVSRYEVGMMSSTSQN